MALALPPVEAEHLVPGGVVQLLHPILEHLRRDDLADAVISGSQEGRAEHAELLLEDSEATAVDHHCHRSAGAGLLQHVLVRAELRIREQLDLDLAAGSLGHIGRETLQPLVKRIGSCERCVDAQCVIRRQRGKAGT
jgi:hypothetical protein